MTMPNISRSTWARNRSNGTGASAPGGNGQGLDPGGQDAGIGVGVDLPHIVLQPGGAADEAVGGQALDQLLERRVGDGAVLDPA